MMELFIFIQLAYKKNTSYININIFIPTNTYTGSSELRHKNELSKPNKHSM